MHFRRLPKRLREKTYTCNPTPPPPPSPLRNPGPASWVDAYWPPCAIGPFSLDLHDSIPHQANTINLCLHHITRFEKLRRIARKTNATRRPSRDDIASFKLHAFVKDGGDSPAEANHHS